MTLWIHGIGTAVPPHFMLQSETAALAHGLAGPEGPGDRTLRALYRKSGIRKRHSVLLERPEGDPRDRQSLYDPVPSPGDPGPTTAARMARYEAEAPPLAAQAARTALEEAGLEGTDITHLVTVSCTGFFAPGLDASLVETLGLPRSVHRTHVGFMGCHGAMNGLRVAASFTRGHPEAKVLVSAVELCSLHLAYGPDPNDLVANAIFGDGAAALVGTGAGTPAPQDGWALDLNGTYLMPDSSDAMSWRIGGHGFRMTLSARVPDLIRAHLADWLGTWLDGEGFSFSDVATWAVHPGGPRILTAAEEALGLAKEENRVSRAVLSEFGNMSSATILFILQRLRQEGAPRPLVALAFGPGLVAEALLIR